MVANVGKTVNAILEIVVESGHSRGVENAVKIATVPLDKIASKHIIYIPLYIKLMVRKVMYLLQMEYFCEYTKTNHLCFAWY